MPLDKNYSKLEKFCRDNGADLFGIADISEVKKGFMIAEMALEKVDRAICLGVRLSQGILNEISAQPTRLYFHHYRTANMFLDQLGFKIAGFIQKEGFLALSIPASQIVDWQNQKAHLSHRHLGVLAGLGWIGRNNLLVNKELGAQFRLVTILTDMPLAADKPQEQNCGACRLCVSACPCGAIKEESIEFDRMKCLEQLKEFQKQRLTDQYICGVCVNACKGARDGSP